MKLDKLFPKLTWKTEKQFNILQIPKKILNGMWQLFKNIFFRLKMWVQVFMVKLENGVKLLFQFPTWQHSLVHGSTPSHLCSQPQCMMWWAWVRAYAFKYFLSLLEVLLLKDILLIIFQFWNIKCKKMAYELHLLKAYFV